MHDLQRFRTSYIALLNRIERPYDSHDNRLIVQHQYQELFEQWEEGEPEGHNLESPRTALRIQFRLTISPIWSLMERIQNVLIVRAATSKEDRHVLKAFNRLPIVRDFEQAIRRAPFRTIVGIDAVLALLQETNERRGPMRSKKAQAAKPSTKQVTRVQSQKESEPKRELRYDPVLLRGAKLAHRNTNAELANFFGVEEESTVSRWLHGRTDMSSEHALKYDEYIAILKTEKKP
jgi:hypothetical protein